MSNLIYKVIKTDEQYFEYCNTLEYLLENQNDKKDEEEIELLSLLIQKWDEEHTTFNDNDPIELLKYLMAESHIKAIDLARNLDVSKGLISEILHYKKGLSKDIIRKLASLFKISQEAFNRPYKLINPINSHLKNASVMNTPKILSEKVS